MRVLVTKLQKVERVAFAPEGGHLFAAGLHSESLGYGEPDFGLSVFNLVGGPDPVAHLVEGLVVRWFAPLPAGQLVVARGTLPEDSNYDVGVYLIDWRTERGNQFVAASWEIWYPCALGPDGTRLVAALVGVGRRATTERGIGIWHNLGDPATCVLDRRVSLGRDRHVLGAAFAPDGRSF